MLLNGIIISKRLLPYAVYAHAFISGSYINIGSHLQATRQEKLMKVRISVIINIGMRTEE